MRTRRVRSELSRNDCLLVLEFFAKKVKRFLETTNGQSFGYEMNVGRGQMVVSFLIEGGFGTADDLFEATRVLSGQKLPRIEL